MTNLALSTRASRLQPALPALLGGVAVGLAGAWVVRARPWEHRTAPPPPEAIPPGMTEREYFLWTRGRAFTHNVLNPLMVHWAGRPSSYAALLAHVGRRSGQPYITPVVAVPTADGFLIPLPYTARVDWCRNVLAAGQCDITLHGTRCTAVAPEIVDYATAAPALKPAQARLYRRLGIDEYLQLERLAPGTTCPLPRVHLHAQHPVAEETPAPAPI